MGYTYRGKPGLGCALCRKRRLSCDRRRPSCSQCLRVHQECSGYRDPNSLRVYDQTQEVAQKARARQAGARKSKSTSPQQSAPPVEISPPPISDDDRAMSHIFTYWVGTDKNQGMLSFLPSLLHLTHSSAVEAAAKAVGFASMTGMQMMPQSKHSAQEAYGMALRATNNALQDPYLAKSDSTLVSVILLSYYELMTCQWSFERMWSSWMRHIQGATKLLELRGEEQLNSDLGMELFTVVRLQNALSSIFFRSASHYSPRISELSRLAKAKRKDNYKPIEYFYDLIVSLVNLSIRVDRVDSESTENLEYLMEEAFQLDTDLTSWATSLNQLWNYTVVDKPPPTHIHNKRNVDSIHGDRYHIYHDLRIVKIWNYYRQLRIIVNEQIRAMALRRWQLQQKAEFQQMAIQSGDLIDQLADDICTSLDFHLMHGATGFASVYLVQWPLFVSALCADENSTKYHRIVQTLDLIARTAGFQQSITFLERLRAGGGRPKGIIPNLGMYERVYHNVNRGLSAV